MPETPKATGNRLNTQQNLVRRKVWEGQVPLRLFLPKDVLEILVGDDTPLVDESPALALLQGTQEPVTGQWTSLWLSPRRLSYLSLEVSRSLFEASPRKAPQQQEVWVVDAHSGVPVKWQYPVGVLYDICVSRNGTIHGQGGWELALVVNRPSVDALPPPLAIDSSTHDAILQPLYLSSLKESDYSRHGSIKRVLSLPKEDQEALWASVSQGALFISPFTCSHTHC